MSRRLARSVSCSRRRRARWQSQHRSEQVQYDSNGGDDSVPPTSTRFEHRALTEMYPAATDFAGSLHFSISQPNHTQSTPDRGRSIQQPCVGGRQAELAQSLRESSDSGSESSQCSPGSTVAQSWILHSFHEDQEYIISSKTRGSPEVTFLPFPRRLHPGSGGSSLQSICQKLYISPQNLSKL